MLCLVCLVMANSAAVSVGAIVNFFRSSQAKRTPGPDSYRDRTSHNWAGHSSATARKRANPSKIAHQPQPRLACLFACLLIPYIVHVGI